MARVMTALSNLATNTVQLVGLGSDTSVPKMKYLSHEEAVGVDEALFEHFSLDCLMELAGLSVASSVGDAYPFHKRVLVVCGPGNNGGQGLVTARHLMAFGYYVRVVYPKKNETPAFQALLRQLDLMRVPVLPTLPDAWEDVTDLVVDAIFGLSSASKKPGAPFDMIIAKLAASAIPVVSVDVPSGWDVDEGPEDSSLEPEVLVSLTAPKKCALKFYGQSHYLVGRYVPPAIQEKFGFKPPDFPGTSQFVRLDVLDDPNEDEADSEDEPEPEFYYF
ncbi:hypothetical protein CTAYLR_009131 [Chrysophaeum taylorii]|uniref:NAD(P)H-hydrate epimerase n=1 Tax=Chrysophaeum taylorii TaxID=2483200 RepID=A0AAD7XM28_9STRA|nr:hypothetical protein CTAYLR_009131 [Chrysophaeum taylorii]